MKKFKSLLSILLAAATVFSLSSCGKTDKKDVTPASTTTTSAAESEKVTLIENTKNDSADISHTEAKTTSDAPAVRNTQMFLEAGKGDKKAFTRLMAMVVGYGREYISVDPECDENGYTENDYFEINYKDYDCTSKDAFKDAFLNVLCLPFYSIFNYYAENYGWDLNLFIKEFFYYEDNDFGYDTPSVRDPLKKFEADSMYYKIDGEKFDFILKNVFNVKPDHSYVLHNKKSRWFPDEDSAYYYNGYYYVLKADGGDGAGPRTVINNMEKQSDGKYKINITYQFGNDFEGYDDCAQLNVIAGLKEINGEKLWSIYSIKKV